jgi:hypothetical protein
MGERMNKLSEKIKKVFEFARCGVYHNHTNDEKDQYLVFLDEAQEEIEKLEKEKEGLVMSIHKLIEIAMPQFLGSREREYVNECADYLVKLTGKSWEQISKEHK